jgi:hypothetical protein
MEAPYVNAIGNDFKKKLLKEDSQLYEKIVQLKFEAADGKQYASDCLNTENLLRLIQSIPSSKAEPFKQWLAKTGYERIEEIQDPEKSIDFAMENYLKLGYSKEWINQRLKSRCSFLIIFHHRNFRYKPYLKSSPIIAVG